MVHTRTKIILILAIALALALPLFFIKPLPDAGGQAPDAAGNAHQSADSARDTSSAMSSQLTLEEWQSQIDRASADDYRRLMEEALGITDPELRHAVMTLITTRWLTEDPRGYIKYFTSLEVHGRHESLAALADALRDALPQLDPQIAASDDIRLVVQRLVSWLSATDPAGALAWARLWLLDDSLDASLVAISRSFARTDVNQGLRLIDEIKNPFRRGQAYAMLGGIWAASNPRSALAWALSLDNRADRALVLNSVLLAMAQTDAGSAATQLKEQAMLIAEQYRAERALELAANGINESELANDRETYLEMLRSGAIAPPTGPDVELMAGAGKVIGSKLAAESAENAIDWAVSLEGEYLQLVALSGVLEGWARTDPTAAVLYLEEKYPGNTDLLKALYGSWAGVDPQAAAGATQRIEDASQRSTALEAVLKVWATKGDASAATGYLAQLPASESTDGVKYTVSTAISQTAPEDAWRIAEGISDPSSQYRALKSAFAVLVTKDPAQAQKTLQSSTLPAQTAARLGRMVTAVLGN